MHKLGNLDNLYLYNLSLLRDVSASDGAPYL